MCKYKLGDKVRVTNYCSDLVGKEGSVVEVTNTGDCQIQIVEEHAVLAPWFYETSLTLIEDKPNSSQERKNSPVFSGVLQYFPDAIVEISRHSKKGSEKHHPGKPLHWDKEKSKDHSDCIARHLIDIGPNWDALDEETQSYHATALAWRALALLQTVLERKKS